MKRFLTWLGTTSAIVAAGVLAAAPASAFTLVKSELVLSVDASESISDDEFNLQRQGYANAFRDTNLINKISNFKNGIAVTLQYWASQPAESLGWFHITDEESAFAFADAIEATTRPIQGSTNIAAAINSATDLLNNNDFQGRKVVDISGDGGQNMFLDGSDFCDPSPEKFGLNAECLEIVQEARDAAVADGVTINGLPVLAEYSELDSYFVDNVIGGKNSFVEVANSFDDFEQAVTAKISREIAVPEPSATLGLLALGLVGGGSMLKKRRDRAQ